MLKNEMETDILAELSKSDLASSPMIAKINETIKNFQSETGYIESDFHYIKKKESNDEFFLTVIMRTQGKRILPMEQALTCLLAQMNQNFNLIICIHNQVEEKGLNQNVTDLVDLFPKGFRDKTSIISVVGHKRGVPMNIGIDNATSEYVAFLDDDDLVTAEWVSSFKESASKDNARIVRNRCVDRVVEKLDSTLFTPQHTKSNWTVSRADNFRFIESLERNSSPLHSYAIPLVYLKQFKTYVNPSVDVAEDWEYLMRNAALLGVTNHPSTTAIYNRWENIESSSHLHDTQTWQKTHFEALSKLTSSYVLTSPEELKEIYNLFTAMYHLQDMLIMMTQNDGPGEIHEKLNELHRYEMYLAMGTGKAGSEQQYGLSIKNDLKHILKRMVKKLIRNPYVNKFLRIIGVSR